MPDPIILEENAPPRRKHIPHTTYISNFTDFTDIGLLVC